MSDSQRPGREAIERAIKDLPCYEAEELEDAPGYFLKKSDVLGVLAALPPTPTPGWQPISCDCPASEGHDCPLTGAECAARRAAREAPADAPPATPQCDAQTCECQCCPHDGGDCACACHGTHAEPPAPPAQVLTKKEVKELRKVGAHCTTTAPLCQSHEALREELKQAQITLLLGSGRADELSSLMKLIVSWTEADAYGHRNEDQSGWRERAATARRAAELLQSTLHLREVAEAEAQALREQLKAAQEAPK
jgi:hypothetical protein